MPGIWHQAGCCCKCYRLTVCTPWNCDPPCKDAKTPAYLDVAFSGITLCSCDHYVVGPPDDWYRVAEGNPNWSGRVYRNDGGARCTWQQDWTGSPYGSPVTKNLWKNPASPCVGSKYYNGPRDRGYIALGFFGTSLMVLWYCQDSTTPWYLFYDIISTAPDSDCMKQHTGTNVLTVCWANFLSGVVGATGGTVTVTPADHVEGEIFVTNDLSAEVGNVAIINGNCYTIGAAEPMHPDAFDATIDDIYDNCEDCEADL